ncbi:hypothetical protein ZIOFF_004011 [Zingiber officinale]|uniref:Pollen-specific protein SF21 n=1 Tax=Zingiber officinale TaxID=94328 RepID=A0A8J5LTW5_ZINOF|nr:hypothetical protein ZIOFF_004011 [Zingiber officinale]
MGESSGSVSVDVERISFGGKWLFRHGDAIPCCSPPQEHHVLTNNGPISVAVYGDLEKPALLTYPDVALNRNVLQLGAAPISSHEPVLSVDQLVDQVAEVLNFFGLGSVMCFGVTAGAYILTLFAGTGYGAHTCLTSLQGSLMVRVVMQITFSSGTLARRFEEILRSQNQTLCKLVEVLLLDEKQSVNVWRFLQSINGRYDLTEALKKLHCRTLIFVGEDSPFHSEAIHMTSKLDKRYCALVEVQACGSVITEEQPHAMLIPMEYFLMGYGLCRPSQLGYSPRSPLSPLCISPELLSPESMGVKLKPIKTRVSLDV